MAGVAFGLVGLACISPSGRQGANPPIKWGGVSSTQLYLCRQRG